MSSVVNHQWILKQRPEGNLGPDNFEWKEQSLGDLGEGLVRVRSIYLSLDPTNRIWASDMPQYMEPVQIGDVMRGLVLGVVHESNDEKLAVGTIVSGIWGWQEYADLPAAALTPLPAAPGVPLNAWISILGATGMTAYFGLLDIGQPKEGETVVVSAAAGAVGSVVGQIAKIKGCRVVGIAGSDEKCAWLTDELGFDAAINYKTEDVDEGLRKHCPDGIDINFENVGGQIMDTILTHLNLKARVVLCGLISSYNATEPVPGPYHFAQILMKRARVEGFIILDYVSRFPEGMAEMGQWIAAGKLKNRVDIVKGLDQAPTAVNRLFDGGNIGKLLVQVGDEPA